MVRYKKEDGWHILERKHPMYKKKMFVAILFKNDKEIKKKWLHSETKQTAFGELLDRSRNSNIIVVNVRKRNKFDSKKYPKSVDFPDRDTRLNKNSSEYKKALKKYRDSAQYRRRYKRR